MQRNVISIFTYLARVGEQLAGVQGDGGLGIAQVERAVVRDVGTLGRHVDRDLSRLAVYEERVSVREETGTLSVFQGCLLQEAVVALETSTHRTLEKVGNPYAAGIWLVWAVVREMGRLGGEKSRIVSKVGLKTVPEGLRGSR